MIQKQDMEPMEIDHIVDIPDTPDRLTTRHDNSEKRDRRFQVADEMNGCSNYITMSPVEKPRPSQNYPIFRRAQTDRIFGLGRTHSNGAEKVDKGKAKISRFPSKSSHHGPTPVLDLTKENGQSQKLHRGSRDNATEDKKELKSSTGNIPLRFIADSSNTSRNRTLAGSSNMALDRGKSIALSSDSQSQLKSEKQVSLPPHISPPPRGRGQKRLVRNGCISPHNIATREKQSIGQGSHRTNDVKESHARDLVCSNTMPMVSVEDIVSEERSINRVKGKQVLVHPSSLGHNAHTIRTASSSLVIDTEGANGTNTDMRNSLRYSGEHGCRTTLNEQNNEQSLYDVNRHNFRRNYDVGRLINRQNMNRMDKRDTQTSQSSKDVCGSSLSDHATQGASLTIQEVGQLTPTRPTSGTLTKRPRKRGSTSAGPNEASLNSELIFISPSGESSSSSRGPGLEPDIVDLSSEPRFTNRLSEGLDDGDDNSSEARARQVEADEILARELQEQLYHDGDSFDGRGFDEHLAWELQQENDLMHTTSTDNHHISHPLWFQRANNQPRTRSHQIPSNRRRAVPQVPFSNRMSQLRSRVVSRSQAPTRSSRGRRPRFPVDMDLNMRLDILEALEDAVGDFMDTGVANDIFHVPHDFNENDYEMLLALDEENHRHTGSSSNQINNLPQSTVQTDNFPEACAICLETPVKGEVIRHLPCLHKFHKDCIDPWLHRKTSCPVCKSSIT